MRNVFELADDSSRWLVNHQLEVNGAYSVGAVVSDVLGPSFAFNVDDDAA